MTIESIKKSVILLEDTPIPKAKRIQRPKECVAFIDTHSLKIRIPYRFRKPVRR